MICSINYHVSIFMRNQNETSYGTKEKLIVYALLTKIMIMMLFTLCHDRTQSSIHLYRNLGELSRSATLRFLASSKGYSLTVVLPG